MTCYLMLDLSDDENAEMLRLAAEAGLSTHDFARRRILGLSLASAATGKPAWAAVMTPGDPKLEAKADAAE